MAYQPVAATALVELIFTLNTQRCENTLYFRHAATGWTEAELGTLGLALQAWWTGEMQAITSNACNLVQIDVTDLSDQFGPKVQLPLSPAVAGAAASEVEPGNVSFCTTFSTGQRGRAFRGRNFFVGLTTDFVVGNAVTNAFATTLRNAYSELLGVTYLPVGVDWVHVARVVNGVVQMPTALTVPVIAPVHKDLNVDSMRRRLTGRGT
jgi:hypothetical protein